MHEFALGQAIVDIVRQESSQRRLRPTAVEITIGRMSDVVPEALSFALETLAGEAGLTGVTFDMRTVPVMMRCRKCDHGYEVTDSDFTCPGCQSTDVELVSGDELEVATIEFEDHIGDPPEETSHEDTS